MSAFSCPNCGRLLAQPALSSVGTGGVAVWRGCGDCFAPTVVAAMRALGVAAPHERPDSLAAETTTPGADHHANEHPRGR